MTPDEALALAESLCGCNRRQRQAQAILVLAGEVRRLRICEAALRRLAREAEYPGTVEKLSQGILRLKERVDG